MTHQDHLFRIYDKDLNCWLTNCTVYQNGTYRGWSEGMPPFPRYSKSANLHLMCRTPFKDKNGRWYFEGDLVKLRYSNSVGVESLSIGFIKTERGQFIIEEEQTGRRFDLWIRPGSYEIVGNIYDGEEKEP